MTIHLKHPWHGVETGAAAPKVVRAVIEIEKGSKAKYELDKDSGLLKLDRVLFSAVHYPANYGFIPQTYCDDKDPLDILVISSLEFRPLSLVDAKVIGCMRMVDNGEQDDKIIAVAATDAASTTALNLLKWKSFKAISFLLVETAFYRSLVAKL